ncbi:Oxaloacetate decarboxylase, gamma chain [Sporobacter termitidis DSM 10068]|uniref:Oxaloacetate decarboxylase, gamma chain n=1 Tax=Sporobacter termitidis DSM 10068 TaxID=1123282 RepID=A0A1M5Y6M0_9FIRM|nr:OadG family protein [Sporobacter termitidis]SHI07464.1 Oxaloacetate decarboxylase, gamma chain [Sporobacter termitidis DSM 10068]
MESIKIALELMGYGLGGVFVSLILLYAVILITRRLFKPESETETEDS